jgi:hypothetical protein
MTQAPQSGGGRSTANVNKTTDELSRLADRATDQAGNVAQHLKEFAYNAAQQGREAGSGSRRLPATSRCCHPGRSAEEGCTGRRRHAADGRRDNNGQGRQ